MRQETRVGAASAVAIVLFFMSAADATQPTLREVERRRAAAELDRKRLQAEADAAARAAAALQSRLKDTAADRRSAEAEAAALEAEAGRLLKAEAHARQQAAVARDAYERSLVALVHTADRQPRAAAVAAHAGRRLGARTVAASHQAAILNAQRRDVAGRRAALAVAGARIDSEAMALQTALAETVARQAVVNAERARAAEKSNLLARQARNLRDLVARAAPGRRGGAAIAPSGALVPASATVVRRFGERLPGGSAQGATLRLAPGARITAPAAGAVVFSGPFRSYGRVLILDLGADYALVLTGFQDARVAVGERVRAGREIAVMAPDATPAPELYVELRRAGRPVDPARWVGR
jgi:septal ring factor EnvC (AmiA/AmiB activator)